MSESPPLLERRFSGLVTKIHAGECVLVLGPKVSVPTDVSDGTPLSLEGYLSRRLLEDIGADATSSAGLRYAVASYERASDPSTCRSLVQELVSQFDILTTDLHQDLARLPFRLVLSASPDRMIAGALRAQGKRQVQEACYNYPRGVAAQTLLVSPTADSPIVYSLFGRHDYPESMVLNDKNLLDYLVRIIKESPALPDAVRATLRAPSTVFLFIGFGFTNWWLRLLLKVLEVTGVENRGLSLALEDPASMDPSQLAENRGFFQSAGIYIQTRDDWGPLARYLASTFRPTPAATAVAASVASASGPLIFLSYASEDALTVDRLRETLERHGLRVWLDKQNLRNGQNWRYQIERVIDAVDYFVFVQSEHMEHRGQLRGVYNAELKKAIEHQNDLPHGVVFILHVTLGECQPRPEPELANLHHTNIDSESGMDRLADDICAIHRGTRSLGSTPDGVA